MGRFIRIGVGVLAGVVAGIVLFSLIRGEDLEPEDRPKKVRGKILRLPVRPRLPRA